MGKAKGGVIRSSGRTDDSVDIKLSRGDFVIPARLVREFGVELLAELRRHDRRE